MNAYIEVSAINRALDDGLSPAWMLKALQERGYVPVVGTHVIYELAKTLLTDLGVERGKTLFGFLDDLSPSVHWPPQEMIELEVRRFRLGTTVLPFLDHLNYVSTLMEVRRFRAGYVSDEARALISRRENEITANVPVNDRKYIAQVEELRAANPGKVRKFRTYQDVLDQFYPDLTRFVLGVVNQYKRLAAPSDAERIAARLDEFPAIRSNVRANMYLMFHCLAHKKGAARDKLGDYRHVAGAAYCDGIVTADRQLARTAPLINPGLSVVRLADLQAHSQTPPNHALEPSARQ